MNEKMKTLNDNDMSEVVGGSIDSSQYGADSKIICPECGGNVPISLTQLCFMDPIFCPNCGLKINLH